MARSGINKVILVGNLGQDPEVKYTAGGAAVTTLSIATSDSWKDKETGEDQERTEWHRVVLWRRLAEIAGEYLKKGSKNFRVRKGADPFTIDLEEALGSIANTKGSGAIKVFEGSGVKIVDGRWGPYITNGKKNASVPKDKDPESLELSDCLSLLEKAPAKKRRAKKSKAAKS